MENRLFEYLDYLYENPRCELNYNKDYELLIAIVLSAQTTDKMVNRVTDVLFKKYNSLLELSKANLSDIEDIIRIIGTFKKKSIYIKGIAMKLVGDGYLYVPNDREYIESLPGVGRKSANVFLSNIYNEPAIAVDTHVSRVSKRLGLCDKDDNVKDIERKLQEIVPKDRWGRTHHQMVLFGRYKCKAIRPICEDCQLRKFCMYKQDKM